MRQADTCEKEAEEYRLSTNDLIQQTRAANAAQAQADIASQQLWTGWLQTLGGFLTLVAAVGAAIYAREAAKETKRANDFLTGLNEPTVHVGDPTITMKDGLVEGSFNVMYFGQAKSKFSDTSWTFWTATEGRTIDENNTPLKIGELSSDLHHKVPIGLKLNEAENVAFAAGKLDMIFEFKTDFLPRFDTACRSYGCLYRLIVRDDKVVALGLSEENFLKLVGKGENGQ